MLLKRTPGSLLSEAELEQRRNAAKARWEKAHKEGAIAKLRELRSDPGKQLFYRGAPVPDFKPKPREYDAVYFSKNKGRAREYAAPYPTASDERNDGWITAYAAPRDLRVFNAFHPSGVPYDTDEKRRFARRKSLASQEVIHRLAWDKKRGQSYEILAAEKWKKVRQSMREYPLQDPGAEVDPSQNDSLFEVLHTIPYPSDVRGLRRAGYAGSVRDHAYALHDYHGVKPLYARHVKTGEIKLAKRQLSEAEIEQRREAAKARWAQHAAATAAGAGLAAGITEGVRRVLSWRAMRSMQDAHREGMQAIAEQKANRYRENLVDRLETKATRAIGPIGATGTRRPAGYARWPVPEYHRYTERVRGRRINDMIAAGQRRDDVLWEMGDRQPDWRQRYPNARPPFLGPRTEAEGTRKSERWTQSRPETREQALLRVMPASYRDNYLKAVEQARQQNLQPPKIDQFFPSGKAPRVRPRTSDVVMRGNVGDALPRSATIVRYQGNPDDQALDRMRADLLDNLRARTASMRTNTVSRTARILQRLSAARATSVRNAKISARRLPKGSALAGGLIGAALGIGASLALSKSDQPTRRSAEDEVATRIAGVYRAWYENPEAVDPGDLATAVEPVASMFGNGAEAQARMFDKAAEGRRKLLIGTFGVRNPRVVEAARQNQIRLVGELSDVQAASIRQALVDHAMKGNSPDTTARAIRESIGLTPTQARHVAAYRMELESGLPGALRRAMRDKRFDPTVEKALAGREPIPPEKIDRMVDAYQRRYIAYRAMTIARTEALRASNEGAVASTRAQLETMPDMTVLKRWVATRDEKTRDHHRALDGQAVMGIDAPFILPNGGTIRYPHDPDAPASETVNCRCTMVFEVIPRERAASRLLAEEVA